MRKQLIQDTLVWGFLLWLFGYLLGIIFFTFMPTHIIGWVIMPIGLSMTYWVLTTRVKRKSVKECLFVSVLWTLFAIALDYVFLVQLFKPLDGYYKPDVYLYYLLIFTLPILVGWRKNSV